MIHAATGRGHLLSAAHAMPAQLQWQFSMFRARSHYVTCMFGNRVHFVDGGTGLKAHSLLEVHADLRIEESLAPVGRGVPKISKLTSQLAHPESGDEDNKEARTWTRNGWATTYTLQPLL